MNMLANGKAKGSDRLRSSFVRHLIVCVTLMTLTLTIKPAIAAPEDEVRATFDRFVARSERTRHQGGRVPAVGITKLSLDHARYPSLGA